MDETPVYIDMVSSKTLSTLQEIKMWMELTLAMRSPIYCGYCNIMHCKSVEELCYVMFKGLKNVPKCNVPSNSGSCVNGRFSEGAVYA